jgi:hypothetical protein
MAAESEDCDKLETTADDKPVRQARICWAPDDTSDGFLHVGTEIPGHFPDLVSWPRHFPDFVSSAPRLWSIAMLRLWGHSRCASSAATASRS